MMRKISMMIIAMAAGFILWNSAEAQYPQDTTMRRMQTDTTMRRMQTDTTRKLYRTLPTDTSKRKGRSNKDTTRVRTWTPDRSTQPDTSTGIH